MQISKLDVEQLTGKDIFTSGAGGVGVAHRTPTGKQATRSVSQRRYRFVINTYTIKIFKSDK
ncbi:hypothetical protein [Nostoc sp. CHAB 5715]|uniref:hypothetical protein n=1 Tax=Nostoc sp. CHAB 5715 TaxID=2780400 RepID=UPI001E56A7D6|nr:hypothetical protein [Nostoc sp. CHAB 5715]MCC5624336.1 hypothetical protein [Nostoc sp. CHAB 5715]